MKIYKIMKQNFITIRPDETIEDALEKMSSMKVNGAPVVDKNDNLVGMIVKADIYRFLITPGHIDKCPVEWVMSKDVITASVDEEVLTVAKRLRSTTSSQLPYLKATS